MSPRPCRPEDEKFDSSSAADPAVIEEGQQIRLDGRCSRPDPSNLTFNWDLGDGRTREQTYYAARGEKLSAGVWEADPSSSDEFYEPDYTELMCLLEGSVRIVDEAGNEELVQAGDVVLVPKGMRYQWKQDEYVRKYWVIFDAD